MFAKVREGQVRVLGEPIASSNPLVKEKIEVGGEINRLTIGNSFCIAIQWIKVYALINTYE